MDPCADVRRRLILELQEQKHRLLQEAEEEANTLREAARRAPDGAVKQAAYSKWHRHQREVLYAAHSQARRMDQEILEAMSAPCDKVRHMARDLGLVVPLEPTEAVGEVPLEVTPEREVPVEAGPPAPPEPSVPMPSAIQAGEGEALEDVSAAHVEEAARQSLPDAEVEYADLTPAELDIPEDLVAAEIAAMADQAAEELPTVTPDEPEAPEVAFGPPLGMEVEEPPDLPASGPDVLDESLAADIVAMIDEAIEEPPDIPPDVPEELVADAVELVPDLPPTPAAEVEPETDWEAWEPLALRPPTISILQDVGWPQAEPPPTQVTAAELQAEVQPEEPDQAAGERTLVTVLTGRRVPLWLAVLLGSIAVLAVVSVIAIVLRNRGAGEEAAQVTPAPPAAAGSATAVAAIAVATDTPTPRPSTPTPAPEPTDTPAPSPTPSPEPSSTASPTGLPTATMSPTATATSAPSRTPLATATDTPLPTETPAPPQIMVDGVYNMRAGPGTNYERAGQVQAGQTLDIVARNAEGTWWQVCCLDGESVWIRADLAPSEGMTSTVAVAAAIPTPPPPTPAGTATPTPEVLPEVLQGRLAFPVYDPGRRVYDLYVANADGSDMQRVLDEASQPDLSPDGQRIAFRRWWGGGRGIGVMNTYGGDVLLYPDEQFLEDALPRWSPDGQALVFFSRREADRRPRLYWVNLVDGVATEITRDREPVQGESPDWMSDGTIVYRTFWPEAGLAITNPDGSGERVLLVDETVAAPAASPDGAIIAFMSRRDGNWEIYRLNSEGSDLVRLTDNGANDGLPAWSPDGRAIAFASDRGGAWAIWAMTPSGQGLRQLFALPGPPDGIIPDEPDYSTRGWVEERLSWSR